MAKRIKFPQKPTCEQCDGRTAECFVATKVNSGKAEWQFLCMFCSQDHGYPIEIHRLFHSPASTVDWLAHMDEKGWMQWDNFMEMMGRFREATQSYNKIY